jgi:pilus assembly protein TadC
LRVRLLLATAAGLAAALVGQSFGGVTAAVGWLALPLLVPLVVVGLGLLEPGHVRRRRNLLILQLPQALELLAACLAAGMPLRQAATAVTAAFDGGPVAEDLSQVLALVRLGTSDVDAWRILRRHPQWGPAAIDVARSVESGTMMVDALMHHARLARELRRSAIVVRAKAVGVRSVLPLMTCFLPAFLLLGVVPTVASAVLNALR